MGDVKMKIRDIILISIILLVGLAGIVTADAPLTPDKISISFIDWPIATGTSQVTFTAHPYNTTNTSVVFPGQPIFFSVDNSALGRINPASVTTGSDGNAVTTFTTTTKSGRAQISVMVLGSTPTLSNTTYLNIDHGDPYEILTPANYTGEQTVGGTIDIKLKLVDKYGNLIDNKGPINPAHPNLRKS